MIQSPLSCVFVGKAHMPSPPLQAATNPRSTHLYVRISMDPPLPMPQSDSGDSADLAGGTALSGDSHSASLSAAIAARPMAAGPGQESRGMLRYAASWAERHSTPPAPTFGSVGVGGSGSGSSGAYRKTRHVRTLVQVREKERERERENVVSPTANRMVLSMFKTSLR